MHWPDPSLIPDPFRDSLPDNSPITFTHADLHPSNILVTSDAPYRVVAIIDWHQSGWYPDYWEYYKATYTASIIESGTLNIYRDLLTSLSVMTLGASMPNLLDANNRRNVGRDSGCAFSKERASAYLDDNIERSSRSDSKIAPLGTLLKQ